MHSSLYTYLVLCSLSYVSSSIVSSNRSFTVDVKTQNFIRDGQPFRYVSGGMHYFRIPPDYWRDRLRKLRAMGANAVETYVEWSLHEPEPDVYDFKGQGDLLSYIHLAQSEGLLVILRPGPYICAERYMGGLPYWLLNVNPRMKIRTSDPSYMFYVRRWMTRLLSTIKPYLYSNGGPIILLQIENEYGSYSACDARYMTQLRDIFDATLGQDAVIYFTTDGNSDGLLKCGQTPHAVTTVDFGHGSDLEQSFATQRKFDYGAPFVNSEYYTGWLDHWSESHSQLDANEIAQYLDKMLSFAPNVNVNLYMFHGGTSFGFTNGANYGGDKYQPDPTSYDYDAPLSEAGDLTEKYYALKQVITSHLGDPRVYIDSDQSPKLVIPRVFLQEDLGSIFDMVPLFNDPPVFANNPLIYELLNQPNGFVIYSHNITFDVPPGILSVLQIGGLHDRAIVFVNGVKQGIASRMVNKHWIFIKAQRNDRLDILVEDLGRIGYGPKNDEFKGITGSVLLNDIELRGWSHQRVPLHSSQLAKDMIYQPGRPVGASDTNSPRFYRGQFVITETPRWDTFVKLPGWTKGMIWINGYNLGRYWPVVGPQLTLYLPGCFLLPPPVKNTLIIFELESAPCQSPQECFVQFTDQHTLNATAKPDPTFDLFKIDP